MKTNHDLIRCTALANISQQKHTYWAFFNGGISKHQAQINQNEAQVIFFTFWIIKLQLHFIGSVEQVEKLGRFAIILCLT